MKRATKCTAPFDEISSHIPLKWHERINKVDKSQTFEASVDSIASVLLSLEQMEVEDVPRSKSEPIYRNAWDTSVDIVKSIQCASSEKTEDSSELKRIECSSSLIPGALVVDPLVQDMVQEGGMRVTENAIWLLVMAMKEHTKNILKNAISHKEAVEKGQIPSRTLCYPKVLAGNTKNNAKRDSTQGKTSAPFVTQQQEAKNKK